MSKKPAKTISYICAISLIIALMPFVISKSVATTDFEYELNADENATITAYIGVDVAVIIPDNIDGYSVTAIGSGAFEYNEVIEYVVIPEGVTEIGSYAFSGCSFLQSAELPSTVTTLGMGAFADCSVLATIDIPYGVTAIPENAFICCFELASVSIPNTVHSIGTSAFMECELLETITIPASVTDIGDHAFTDCLALTAAYFLGAPPTTSSGDIFILTAENAPSENFCVYYHRSHKESWLNGSTWTPTNSLVTYSTAPFGMDVDTMGAQAYSDGSRFRFAFDISIAGLQEMLNVGDTLEIGFLVRSRANYDLDGVLNKVSLPLVTWTQAMDSAIDAAELKDLLYEAYFDEGMRVFFAEGDAIRFVLAMGNMTSQRQTQIVFGGYATIGGKEYRSILKQNSINGILASSPSAVVE